MIKNILQLTLLLSCVILFASQEMGIADEINISAEEYPVEDNYTDTENIDVDWVSNQHQLLYVAAIPKEHPLLFNNAKQKITTSYTSIRAPPALYI